METRTFTANHNNRDYSITLRVPGFDEYQLAAAELISASGKTLASAAGRSLIETCGVSGDLEEVKKDAKLLFSFALEVYNELFEFVDVQVKKN